MATTTRRRCRGFLGMRARELRFACLFKAEHPYVARPGCSLCRLPPRPCAQRRRLASSSPWEPSVAVGVNFTDSLRRTPLEQVGTTLGFASSNHTLATFVVARETPELCTGRRRLPAPRRRRLDSTQGSVVGARLRRQEVFPPKPRTHGFPSSMLHRRCMLTHGASFKRHRSDLHAGAVF
jgi:hypothetical protein